MEELFEDDVVEENKEEVLNARFTDLLNTVPNKNTVVEPQVEKVKEADEFDDFEALLETSSNSNIVKPKNDIQEVLLEDVMPLPISYNPQTAADELNLPVVLIEEFVDDFIEQARQDKDHLLTSYYQKDMDNIHELGHKLKGAASNLRINELADILEEIQFCTEHNKLEGLFIKYWGHFLSLEDYMKQLNRD